MYNVKIDENGFFIGSYAAVGKVDGGIDLPSLPPDMSNAMCYQYLTKQIPNTVIIPVMNETTGEPELNEDGTQKIVEETIYTSVTDWFLNEEAIVAKEATELVDYKANKKVEIQDSCKHAIYAGATITTSLGEEHFTFNADDQINWTAMYVQAKTMGVEIFRYHANTYEVNDCRFFSKDEVIAIVETLESLKTWHLTYCNKLYTWLFRCKTKEEIDAIQYGMKLPDDLDAALVELTGRSSK
jgi:hypothetical protein